MPCKRGPWSASTRGLLQAREALSASFVFPLPLFPLIFSIDRKAQRKIFRYVCSQEIESFLINDRRSKKIYRPPAVTSKVSSLFHPATSESISITEKNPKKNLKKKTR
ncbi:hypothetical protein FA13DRAFT_953849 [Coprinellus micaceus]|uniref:Uncharacterized protein n=1 Tax=Coprinellus micaceus TaxID=71717 RepID=A0A4Y7RYK3_COPMI|nr:hypothetical protein FA13DRAFT_953849 [Coprinellus micaceus]